MNEQLAEKIKYSINLTKNTNKKFWIWYRGVMCVLMILALLYISETRWNTELVYNTHLATTSTRWSHSYIAVLTNMTIRSLQIWECSLFEFEFHCVRHMWRSNCMTKSESGWRWDGDFGLWRVSNITETCEKQWKYRLGRGKAGWRGMAKGLSDFKAPSFVPFATVHSVTLWATDANTFHSSTQRRGVELSVCTPPEQSNRWGKLAMQGIEAHFWEVCVYVGFGCSPISQRCWLYLHTSVDCQQGHHPKVHE